MSEIVTNDVMVMQNAQQKLKREGRSCLHKCKIPTFSKNDRRKTTAVFKEIIVVLQKVIQTE
jgi:hypothetical protein